MHIKMQAFRCGSPPPGSPVRYGSPPPGSPLGKYSDKVRYGSPPLGSPLGKYSDKVRCGSPLGSPAKKMMGVVPSKPPRAPIKIKKASPPSSLFEDDIPDTPPKGITGAFPGFLPGSPLPSKYGELLGTGSFAEVYKAKLHDGTPVAVKSQQIDVRSFPLCDAEATVAATSGAGVPGCITAFCDYQNEVNGDIALRTIMPIATPLNNLSNATLQTLLHAIKNVTDLCPTGVLIDLTLENMGFLEAGNPTIRINDDGVLVGGEPLSNDCVCAIDLGCSSNPDPSAANNDYAALNARCDTPEDIRKIREFKWELIRAQIMHPNIPILKLRDMISKQVFGE